MVTCGLVCEDFFKRFRILFALVFFNTSEGCDNITKDDAFRIQGKIHFG